MTGRRVYDLFTDSVYKGAWSSYDRDHYLPSINTPSLAWAALTSTERRVWNELARRITPKRKAAKA